MTFCFLGAVDGEVAGGVEGDADVGDGHHHVQGRAPQRFASNGLDH